MWKPGALFDTLARHVKRVRTRSRVAEAGVLSTMWSVYVALGLAKAP